MRSQTSSRWSILVTGLALLTSACSTINTITRQNDVEPGLPTPMLPVLDQFSAADVPSVGKFEVASTRNWQAPVSAPALPGDGLAEHPMLYVGEGFNTLFVVNHGKVVWTYSVGPGGEIDDAWMLTNGHILFSRQYQVMEITPKKEIVWHYDPPKGTEIHTCQPIGLDKVLLVQNGLPPKLMVINKGTGAIELQHDLPAESFTDQKTVHPQFRRARMTAEGTYLLAFLKMGQVVEYDQAFNPIWTYRIPTPWAAARLHNGDTLITDERDKLVREVNPKGETVWQFGQSDLPSTIVLHNLQTAERLANDDTVIFSSTGGSKKDDRNQIIQAIEVTPDKKVVWILQDWKNLGPATTAQFLDEPGIPEHPGDLQR